MQKFRQYGQVQIIDRLLVGEIVPLINEKIMTEYEEVLQRSKFRFPKEIPNIF